MASAKWCNLCNRNVVPTKKFNWLLFIFLCGIFYLPYYWFFKKETCPICEADNFGSPRQSEMGKQN
jgi:hypothetical protein